MEETGPPRVFISYSHDSVEHQQRTLAFADRLRSGGIDAEIDQYNAAPPEGWPLWCERQIEAADFVLMICTESYHRRVGGDEAPGQGLGVVWEARIIRQLLYDAGAVSAKFIPVLFSGAASAHIPTPVKGGTWYVVDTEDGYESLYRRLTQQPGVVRPALGKLRPLPPRQPRWTEGVAGQTASPPAPEAERTVTGSGNHGVAIGGSVSGGAVVTGDDNGRALPQESPRRRRGASTSAAVLRGGRAEDRQACPADVLATLQTGQQPLFPATSPAAGDSRSARPVPGDFVERSHNTRVRDLRRGPSSLRWLFHGLVPTGVRDPATERRD